MLQTADDNPTWDPKSWNIVDSTGTTVHSVDDESQKERMTETNYRLEGNGVWTDSITLTITETQGDDGSCQYCRFQILTSEAIMAADEDSLKPWQFVPNEETDRLEFAKIEEKADDIDASDLKEIDLEQAYEVGFF